MTSRMRTLAASFRVRLVLGYMLVVTVLAGVWAWSLYGPLTQGAVDQQRSHLGTIAQVSALALTDSTGTPSAEVLVLNARTGLRVTIVAADGTVLGDSAQDASTMENHAGRPEIAAALRGVTGSDTRLSATQGIEQMYVAVPATLDASHNPLEWLWEGLPPAARVVASALAQAGPGAITEETVTAVLRESGVRVLIRELREAPKRLVHAFLADRPRS